MELVGMSCVKCQTTQTYCGFVDLDVIQVVSLKRPLVGIGTNPTIVTNLVKSCNMMSRGFVPNDGFPLENTPWLVSKFSTSVNDLHFIKQKPEKSLKHHSCLQKIQVAGLATTSRHIPNHSIGNVYSTRYCFQIFRKNTCIFAQRDMSSSKLVSLDLNWGLKLKGPGRVLHFAFNLGRQG